MKRSRTLDDYVKNYQENLKKEKEFKAEQKEKKKFKLSIDSIKTILDNRVIPKHKGIRYEIYKAKDSNSYYVKFWQNKTYVTARISDHDSYVGAIGSVVDEETTKVQITTMFEERLRALRKKSKLHLFKIIERKSKTNTV